MDIRDSIIKRHIAGPAITSFNGNIPRWRHFRITHTRLKVSNPIRRPRYPCASFGEKSNAFALRAEEPVGIANVPRHHVQRTGLASYGYIR